MYLKFPGNSICQKMTHENHSSLLNFDLNFIGYIIEFYPSSESKNYLVNYHPLIFPIQFRIFLFNVIATSHVHSRLRITLLPKKNNSLKIYCSHIPGISEEVFRIKTNQLINCKRSISTTLHFSPLLLLSILHFNQTSTV